MWTQSRYIEGKHGTQFRGKKDILTKVKKESVQYWYFYFLYYCCYCSRIRILLR